MVWIVGYRSVGIYASGGMKLILRDCSVESVDGAAVMLDRGICLIALNVV